MSVIRNNKRQQERLHKNPARKYTSDFRQRIINAHLGFKSRNARAPKNFWFHCFERSGYSTTKKQATRSAYYIIVGNRRKLKRKEYLCELLDKYFPSNRIIYKTSTTGI